MGGDPDIARSRKRANRSARAGTDNRSPGEAANGSGRERPPSPDLIDRNWYRDPEIFALERERIFRRAWHFACTLADVANPGDYYTVTVADEPVIVIRGKDGELRAFLNVCTHRGAILTEDCIGASGNCGAALRCMYHGWSFDTAGRLIGVPYHNAYGKDFDREALGLVPVHCESFESLVFVAIDPLRPTLGEFLGEAAAWMAPAMKEIEPIGRVSWTYDGNWKLWHENFRDNYHPQFVHGLVSDLTPDYPEGGSNHGLRPGHSLLRWPIKPPHFDRFDKRLKERSGLEVDSLKAFSAIEAPQEFAPWYNIVALFPNFDFQQPGPHVHGMQVCNPIAVDKTRVDITFMAPKGDDEPARRYRLRTEALAMGCWGEVSVDDDEAAERAMIGLRSRGTRYSNIGRGTAPGQVGETLDEYSQREFYREYCYYLFDAPGA
jgi:benzoate/toluate 1,2-dioxygenase alpha subunit